MLLTYEFVVWKSKKTLLFPTFATLCSKFSLSSTFRGKRFFSAYKGHCEANKTIKNVKENEIEKRRTTEKKNESLSCFIYLSFKNCFLRMPQPKYLNTASKWKGVLLCTFKWHFQEFGNKLFSKWP